MRMGENIIFDIMICSEYSELFCFMYADEAECSAWVFLCPLVYYVCFLLSPSFVGSRTIVPCANCAFVVCLPLANAKAWLSTLLVWHHVTRVWARIPPTNHNSHLHCPRRTRLINGIWTAYPSQGLRSFLTSVVLHPLLSLYLTQDTRNTHVP